MFNRWAPHVCTSFASSVGIIPRIEAHLRPTDVKDGNDALQEDIAQNIWTHSTCCQRDCAESCRWVHHILEDEILWLDIEGLPFDNDPENGRNRIAWCIVCSPLV